MTQDTNHSISVDSFMDACGLFCPEPVMMLHSKMRDIGSGQILEIRATDPSTTRDIPKFCLFLGHDLLKQQEVDGVYFYWIKKA